MEHRTGGIHQAIVTTVVQAKARLSDISQKDLDAGIEPMLEEREIHVKLHGMPQLHFSFAAVFGTDQKIEIFGVALQQSKSDVGTQITCGACDESCHDLS